MRRDRFRTSRIRQASTRWPGMMATTCRTSSMHAPAPSRSPRCDVTPRAELSARDRDEMFALYASYFAADRDVFERDLDEKHWVVLLRDDEGRVDGFSTLMRLDVGEVTVFFS